MTFIAPGDLIVPSFLAAHGVHSRSRNSRSCGKELSTGAGGALRRQRSFGLGVVASLNRRGANVTGISVLSAELAPKQLQCAERASPTYQENREFFQKNREEELTISDNHHERSGTWSGFR